MRYSADQKQQTRDRIVSEASRLFRKNGYSASGVDAVMKAAGLTAGGFYAHFEDKDALLAEAFLHCPINLTGKPAPASGDAGMNEFVDRYLSAEHLNRPADGCPLPSLAGEIPRQPKKVRKAFTRALNARLDRLSEIVNADSPDKQTDGAIEALASVAGALLLARAVDDGELRERILRVMRESVKNRYPGKPR